ncbi:MAG: endonuclease III [Spirochaetaceae bacterium]|nr:MAG: endonuclease III [Spirochaetaceae bacterium]
MAERDPDDRRRARAVLRILERTYPDVRPLLHHDNPYQLLIAVILSAQTTDAQVNSVTGQLFREFPTPRDLARAQQRAVEHCIHSTGFFRAKARNIRAAAGQLCERFDGRVPHAMSDLLSLPGVGRKTANVVRGALFGKPAIIVDTHFARVSRRLALTDATAPQRIEKQVAELLPPASHYSFSMRVNYHGRYRCLARRPECQRCEIRILCPYPESVGCSDCC